MADIVDAASDLEQELLDARIRAVREKAKELERSLDSKGKGHCLNCHEPLTQGRFCDASCREDFDMRTEAKLRSGVNID